jgi:predicted  nucleic acid-binding Zn-ribbon protein
VILALAAALGAAAWYGNTRLAGHDTLLSQLKSWPEAVAAVQQRIGDAEQRLAELPVAMEAIRERMAGFDRRVAIAVERAQKSTRDLGVAVRSEIEAARRDAQTAAAAQERSVEARFREAKSERDSDLARVAQLEQELARIHARLGGVGAELDHLRGSAARDSEQLREEIGKTDRRVTEVASFNNRTRQRFDVARGKTQEIAPGILLHVTRTDPRFHRFHGWIQLDDGKFVWLRDRSMLQSVSFYAGKDTLRHDLVVTALTSRGVTGYVILPRRGELEGREAGA